LLICHYMDTHQGTVIVSNRLRQVKWVFRMKNLSESACRNPGAQIRER